MGSGIATACLLAGIQVVLKEIKQEFLDAGVGRIQSNLTSMVRKGRMTEDKARQLMSLVKPTLTDQDFRQCDMVIEAVIENLPLKQKIFCELERICKPDCILSTNTSTIDITKIAAKMKNPERIVGAHFFSPAHVMQLFEIIRTDATPAQILVDTLGLSKQIKKTPVVVGNCTGFAVNRIFFPYTMSATVLVDIGCDPYAIDRAIMMSAFTSGRTSSTISPIESTARPSSHRCSRTKDWARSPVLDFTSTTISAGPRLIPRVSRCSSPRPERSPNFRSTVRPFRRA
jgi:enoyl-CoA hydratase/3-hydroxyacyl-CoA dehydrogenase